MLVHIRAMKAPTNKYRQDDSCLFLRDLDRRGEVWDGVRLDEFIMCGISECRFLWFIWVTLVLRMDNPVGVYVFLSISLKR